MPSYPAEFRRIIDSFFEQGWLFLVPAFLAVIVWLDKHTCIAEHGNACSISVRSCSQCVPCFLAAYWVWPNVGCCGMA